jgi:putative Mg2+ transporter-C (MgtC) family protein
MGTDNLGCHFCAQCQHAVSPVVNQINRRPLDSDGTELTAVVYLIVARGEEGELRDQVFEC